MSIYESTFDEDTTDCITSDKYSTPPISLIGLCFSISSFKVKASISLPS